MPINIPPLITNTGNETSLYGIGVAPPSGGVTTLNALDGVVQLVASAIGTSGIVVSNDTLLNTISLTTSGVAQTPASVTASGAVSGASVSTVGAVSCGSVVSTGAIDGTAITASGALSGATLAGAFLGTTIANPADLTARQTVNIVIGNTRIQCGQAVGDAGANWTVTYATAYSGLPIVYLTPTSATNFSNVSTRSTSGAGGSTEASAPVYWLAIGPA
jgi:hypothetical protein